MISFLQDGGLLMITCLMSLIPCGFVIFLYLLQADRSYGFGLILLLCLSDFGNVLIIIICVLRFYFTGERIIPESQFCFWTGSLKIFFLDSTCTTTMQIIWTLYRSVIRSNQFESTQSMKSYMVFVFGLPFLSSSIVFFTQMVGPQEPFYQLTCSISNGVHNNLLYGNLQIIFNQLIYFWVAFFFQIFVIVKIKMKFSQEQNSSFYEKILLRMLIYYPLILLLQLPLVTIRTLQLFEIRVSGIDDIAYYMVTLQGFFNCLVYGKYSNFDDYYAWKKQSESTDRNSNNNNESNMEHSINYSGNNDTLQQKSLMGKSYSSVDPITESSIQLQSDLR